MHLFYAHLHRMREKVGLKVVKALGRNDDGVSHAAIDMLSALMEVGSHAPSVTGAIFVSLAETSYSVSCLIIKIITDIGPFLAHTPEVPLNSLYELWD